MGAALTVTIVDEALGEAPRPAIRLELVGERTTLRELIRRRVEAEVAAYNAATPEYYRGLVRPDDAERTVHGFRVRHRRSLDAAAQVAAAFAAFERNGFVVVHEGCQITHLDDQITVGPGAEVRFVRLVPLAGG